MSKAILVALNLLVPLAVSTWRWAFPQFFPRLDVVLMPWIAYGVLGPAGLMVATPLCALSAYYPIPLISRLLNSVFEYLIAVVGPVLYVMEAWGAVAGGYYLDSRLSKSSPWVRFLVFVFLLFVVGWSFTALAILSSWRWISLGISGSIMVIVIVASLFGQRPVAGAFSLLSSCVFMLLASRDANIWLKLYSVGAAPGISLMSPRLISSRWIPLVSILVVFSPSYPELRTWQPLMTLSIFMGQLVFGEKEY